MINKLKQKKKKKYLFKIIIKNKKRDKIKVI